MLWSEQDLERWFQQEQAAGTWAKDRSGDSEGFFRLAQKYLFESDLVNYSEQGQHFYEVARTAGAHIIQFALQMVPNVPTPAIDHIRTAGLISAAASVVPPQLGSIDDDLNDVSISNIAWAEGIMQRMHIIAIARLLQALAKSKGATGF